MTEDKTEQEITFLFVVDGARLEAQSVLLATSLRRCNPDSKLIAYLSPMSNVSLPDCAREVFNACGVECRVLPEHGDMWKRDYPHGNKLFALADQRDSKFSVFLDTDMIATKPMDSADLPGPFEISVVPEGVASWGKNDDRWERAYAHYGMPVPTERVRLTRRKRLEFLPYFNAGFVALREEDRVDGKGFGRLWLETASDFDFNAKIGGKRPWLDQITLPLTMKRFGYRYKIVPTENNFSISDRVPETDADPAFMHYHRSRYLLNWPQWRMAQDVALDMVDKSRRVQLKEMLQEEGFDE
ncbi:MAG: hypothetical protein WBO29_01445 [Albidovulum sp.]